MKKLEKLKLKEVTGYELISDQEQMMLKGGSGITIVNGWDYVRLKVKESEGITFVFDSGNGRRKYKATGSGTIIIFQGLSAEEAEEVIEKLKSSPADTVSQEEEPSDGSGTGGSSNGSAGSS